MPLNKAFGCEKLKMIKEKTDMSRTIRYQAAIMSGEEILLIKHQEHKNGRAY